ncbi:MAG: hypothetical protein KKD48_01955 [Nanoarchaeota archaeon]|nr:hypothetical protein [Nanoarchaeota archaeon]
MRFLVGHGTTIAYSDSLMKHGIDTSKSEIGWSGVSSTKNHIFYGSLMNMETKEFIKPHGIHNAINYLKRKGKGLCIVFIVDDDGKKKNKIYIDEDTFDNWLHFTKYGIPGTKNYNYMQRILKKHNILEIDAYKFMRFIFNHCLKIINDIKDYTYNVYGTRNLVRASLLEGSGSIKKRITPNQFVALVTKKEIIYCNKFFNINKTNKIYVESRIKLLQKEMKTRIKQKDLASAADKLWDMLEKGEIPK